MRRCCLASSRTEGHLNVDVECICVPIEWAFECRCCASSKTPPRDQLSRSSMCARAACLRQEGRDCICVPMEGTFECRCCALKKYIECRFRATGEGEHGGRNQERNGVDARLATSFQGKLSVDFSIALQRYLKSKLEQHEAGGKSLAHRS